MGLASKYGDLVMGTDVHLHVVPFTPFVLPLPTSFNGKVEDLVQMALRLTSDSPSVAYVAMALNPVATVVNMIADRIEGTSGGPVKINDSLATTTVVTASNMFGMPHTITPPGILFPGLVPSPVMLGDAKFYFGSSSVWINGRRSVRADDRAFSCFFPVRLPVSTISVIPAGRPVIIGGSSVPDVQAAISGEVRAIATEAIQVWVGHLLDNVLARISRARVRGLVSTDECTRTGHPIDVATGRCFTSMVDWELPGPIPLAFEREYSSIVSDRDGALGFGWNHPLDQSIWLERGRVVYRAGDGREIEFDTVPFEKHVMRAGDEAFDPVNRLTLRCRDRGWKIETADGVVHEFLAVRGDRVARWKLSRMHSRDGHEVALEYDESACLAWVRDSAGRVIRFEHDANGHLVRISLPHPNERTWIPHTQYQYSPEGNLVAVTDALGNVTRYEYSGHLMVREMDRNGRSFYFGYDGNDSSAWCVRTWGDKGIFDHQLEYDKAKRVTIVKNSLGEQTVYRMNEALQVVAAIDAHGGTTKYEYDAALRKVREIDPLEHETRWEYDARGNCTRVVNADATDRRMEYDARNLRTRLVNEIGAEWRWEYDLAGRLARAVDPVGHTMRAGYENGLLAWVEMPGGGITRLEHDAQKNVSRVIAPNGGASERKHDNLGRQLESRNPLGGVTRIQYDAMGNVLAVQSPTGVVAEYSYDREGNLLDSKDATRNVKLKYGGFYKVVAREEAGTKIRLEYDTEDRLTAVVNEAGEKYTFELDARGLVKREVTFDGIERWYERDKAGRVTVEHLSRGRENAMTYDAMGRLTQIAWWDGKKTEFAWRADGALLRAKNASATVEYQRDALGRVVRESVGGNWIASQYGADGARALMESSLGARQAVVRDALGDVSELHHGHGAAGQDFVVQFQRDALGLEVGRWMPGGVHQTWERDLAGRPLARKTRQVRQGAVAEELDARSYQWRGEDQIAAIIDAVRGPTFYQHDTRGRLIAQKNADGSVLHRAMDAVGNVFRREDRSDRVYGKGGRIVKDVDGTAYKHDDDGNLVEKREADGGVWKYRWDAAGMLKAVERPDGKRVEMEYDALARRTRKMVLSGRRIENGSRFLWDGDFVVHEQPAMGAVQTWYWEPGSWAPVVKEAGGKRWSVATDHLGTPTEMRDEVGRLAWAMQLDAFGVAREEGEAGSCPWRWAGQSADFETGLVFNRWRFYDSAVGEYVSPDPLGIDIGTAFFSYPSDPVLSFDPLGLMERPQPGEPLFVGTYSASAYGNRLTGLNSGPVPYTPHHAVQNAVSGVSHGRGITINIPRTLHEFTATMRARRPPMTVSQHLAQDIIELRILLRAYGFDARLVDQQLMELERQNREVQGSMQSCK